MELEGLILADVAMSIVGFRDVLVYRQKALSMGQIFHPHLHVRNLADE